MQILPENCRFLPENKNSVESEWRERFKECKNVYIKVFDDENTVELCSSILIDEKILRLDIYDPARARSLDGYLIEVRNEQAENINLINWFNCKFNSAWERAYSTKIHRFFFRIFLPIVLPLIVAIVAFLLYLKFNDNDIAKEIILLIVGSAITYFFKNILPIIKSIWRAIKKVLKQED